MTQYALMKMIADALGYSVHRLPEPDTDIALRAVSQAGEEDLTFYHDSLAGWKAAIHYMTREEGEHQK